MFTRSQSRRWRISKPQLATVQLRYASSPRPTDQVETRLTPSQLLRFSMTGTTAGAVLNHRIQDLFGHWPLNTRPSPEFGLFKPICRSYEDVPLDSLEFDVQHIHQLQAFIERHVTNARCATILQENDCQSLREALRQCERNHSSGDILCAINGIVARLERLQAPVSKSVYLLGMHYACLSLSAPALDSHLEGYCHVTSDSLDPATSVSLVDNLLSTLQSIQFGNPEFPKFSMLNVITREGGTNTARKLHDILSWKGPSGPASSIQLYILLLTHLRSQTVLREALEKSLRENFSDSRFPGHFTYACVLALADAGKAEDARTYLSHISERCGGTLPGISKFRGLSALLAHGEISELLPKTAGEQEYMDIVENQLGHMEARLGITWQPMGSVHTSISDPRCIVSDKPLLSMDGDSAGFDSIERLIAEIRCLGCSKSLDDLGMIADLLNVLDGSEIPVCLPTLEDYQYELAWRPQCSPIEFSNAPHPARYGSSAPWSPSTLGLIRCRLESDGIPCENEQSLHLMQLGYLVMRRGSPRLPSNMAESGEPWQDTGHIVAWDRIAGKFLIVFVGKGHGLVDSGTPQPSLQPPPGLSPATEISVSGHFYSRDLETTESYRRDLKPWWETRDIGLHFDLEPGVKL